MLPLLIPALYSDVFVKRQRQRAFSLTELLVVIAVLAVLAVFSAPTLSSLLDGSKVNRVAGDISLLLEQSRTAAMARNTYVWVGFTDDTDDLSIAAVAGTTGQADDLSTGNITPVEKVRTYEDFRTAQVTGLEGMETGGNDIDDSLISPFTQTTGGTSVSFTKVLRFSPLGEVSIGQSRLSRCIDIGLLPVKNGEVKNENPIAFQVSGLTGQVRIFRK
ncbi:MAG: Tfp pilus assembly protein FimT/FimU [Chthoniobacterales bacterium]